MHNHCVDFSRHCHHSPTFCSVCGQWYCAFCGVSFGPNYPTYPPAPYYPVYPIYPDWTWRPWTQPYYGTYTPGSTNSNITYSSL